MAKAPQTAITPTRADDYPEWYQQVVRASDLAEQSPVRGCMRGNRTNIPRIANA